MAGIPEGVETVTGEGIDVRNAVIDAAQRLGVDAKQVAYQLDLSHFRSPTGGSVSRSTVRVIAWAKPAEPAAEEPAPKTAPAPAEEAPEAEERRPEKREKREAREAKDEERAPAPAAEAGEVTEASKAAEAWFAKLLELMGLQGTVSATGTSERVRLVVSADSNGRIIGRRGATLAAIRHLLRLALLPYGDFVIDVDIPDGRGGERPPREERGRDERRGREERGRREDRGRDERRGREERGRRDDRRERRGGGGQYPEEKLVAIAERAAAKALETGKAVTINLVLNSHDRRIVHVAVAGIDGVESQSILKGDVKYVQVLPLLTTE